MSERKVGVTSRGIRAPIIKEGDNLIDIVTTSIIEASKNEGFEIHDKDVVCITESIVARSQGNYATTLDIRDDLLKKFNKGKDERIDDLGVIFPILSRNRFAILLRGIALAAKKIVLVLSYPSDEVGNHLVRVEDLDQHGINPYVDTLTLEKYRDLFKNNVHEFTGVDYVEYYSSLIKESGSQVEIIFSNNPLEVLKHTKNVINADIHTRKRTKKLLLNNGGENVYSLDDILTESINNSGYNPSYGLLGSNKASEEKIKLFPINCQELVEKIQAKLLELTSKHVEVMVYGDGAFKDPQGKIWELADPVVSPGFTSGLKGTPNELKLKFLADNEFKDLKGEELKEAMIKKIKEKEASLVGNMVSEGTTPRQITDLLGSLADLTSGSGDKGTPIVYIQGYFDNYAN